MLYINRIVCNISVAEELTEDTFVKIAVKKPKYKEKNSFKSWLYTIGRNIAIDYIKKNHRMSNKPIDDYKNLSDQNDIEINYLKDEEKIEVHKALSNLKTEYSQVIYLTYFEGLSNADVAAVMHKSKRQIENLLYNAKKALKSKLENGGFQYEGL